MQKQLVALALGAMIGLTGISSSTTANAQSVTIGNDARQMAKRLQRQGFTDIVVVKRGFTITSFEACRDGTKYLVKMNLLGQIKSNTRLGQCAAPFGAKDAVTAMQKSGYTDIDARPSGDQVVAIGCRENRKFELTFNLRGDVVNRTRQGRCRADALQPRQVRQGLRELGYDRIKFTDRELPRYVAEACSDRNRMELVINRRGQINRERRIGACPGPIDPANIAPVLRKQGYDRVEDVQTSRAPYMVRACKGAERQEIIVSRYGQAMSNTKIGQCRGILQPAGLEQAVEDLGYDRINILRGNRTPYLVEACKGRNLVELTIGRRGKVRNEERIGSCRQPLTKNAAEAKLLEAGYAGISLKNRGNGSWAVEACKGRSKVELQINRRGELARERKIGTCKSKTVSQMIQLLESRNANQLEVFIKGCYRKQAYRWTFDRLGNQVRSAKIPGAC